MFTNKVNQGNILDGKGKERVPLINHLVNVIVWK